MKTILFYFSKGGVAKTTTAFNIAWDFAVNHNKKVLVIDLDPEQHLSTLFGYDSQTILENGYNTIANVFAKELNSNGERLPITDCIYQVDGTDNIDIVPSDDSLAQANSFLAQAMINRTGILKQQLSTIQDRYDICVLDCSSYINEVSLNAMVAMDYIVPTVQSAYLALNAMSKINTIITDLHNEGLSFKVAGVVCTMYQTNASHDKQCIEILNGQLELLGVVRQRVAVKDSQAAHLPIFLFDSKCVAGKEYSEIANKLLAIMEV